ncbi:MAG: caspase family protein, partial [Hyphomicrobiaceae bacterium]
MRLLVLFAAATLFILTGVDAVLAKKRVALVIGNSGYQHTAPLKNPRNDATDVSRALTSLGFEVIRGLDLDKAAMEKVIRRFAVALDNAHVGLFFYAGHGLQVAGQNYLVPIDAKAETSSALDFEMIRLALVQRTMERATKTNILLLDACRNNPMTRNLARALGTRSASIGKGLAQVEAGIGTLISYATQPGNVAYDGEGRNSPYSEALKKRLLIRDDDLTSVLINVRNDVMAATANRQIPWDQHALTARLYLAGQPAKESATVSAEISAPASSSVPANKAPASGSGGEKSVAAAASKVQQQNGETIINIDTLIRGHLEIKRPDKQGHSVIDASNGKYEARIRP